MSISGADRSSPTGIPNEDGVHRKEVDYYLNPTELFRWINYRRWDGAKARVLSHAEECSTWIVSRHNNDGRILWRHLPLHLVCMQSDANGMEELVDILLEAYPDAASSPDDQGMLPLHLTVANSIKPNERLIHLLLLCYPTGVDIKDKYGRTPLDLVKEKAENGPHRDAALRAMVRAKATTQTLVHALRDENTELIANQLKTHGNERMASQRIIMRLEEDLDITRKRMDELLETSTVHTGTAQQLAQQVDHLKLQLDSSHNATLSVRRERDELMHQLELLETQVNEHDRIVSRLHEDFAHDRQSQSDMIANLRSEVSTAKAMATALESQLKSRFTNEEYLTTTVTELETKLSDMTIDHQQERKILTHERDKYETENTQLQRQVDELSKKSSTLQAKLVAVNKQMSAVLSSHGALNAEHDRILDANLRLEADLIEHSRSERTNIMASLKKQWEMMETTLKHQESVLTEAEQKEQEILSQAKDERDRSLDVISRMRQDFRDARSSALERARGNPTEIACSAISIAGSGRADPLLEPRASERPTSGLLQHLDTRSIGSHTHAPSSIQGGSVVPSTSSSQPTRRINSRSEDTMSLPSIIKSDAASGFFGKHGASSLRQPHVVESRTPSAEMSMERRQTTEQQQQMDRNLLQMLEARAADGHRSVVSSSNESSTFGTSSTASSIHRMSTQTNKPRLINMPRVNFDSSTTSSHSSSPRNNSRQSSTQNYSREPKSVPLMSLDDYSHTQSASSASVDSDSDSSSTRESVTQHHSKNSQYSGMTAGMRMGMIRIAEEDSVGSDADSRYSRQ
jgi:hypothetical protein